MPFRPKTYEEILTDQIAFIRANSQITDFNVGSVIRTILEASALEAREIYGQMVRILKAFSYRTASGDDLDKRASDFNIVRMPAARSFGYVILMDDNLKRSYFVDPVQAGASTAQVEDASVFPPTPFNVKVGEKTANEETNTVSGVDTSTNILTFSSAFAYAHEGISTLGSTVDEWNLGSARVSEMDGSVPKTVNSGLLVSAPPVGDLPGIEFTTTEGTILLNGDFQSNDVPVISSLAGTDGNIGPKRIRAFPASSPFNGALVVNTRATGGGSFAESDQEFVDRIERTIGSLSGATVNAILATARNVSVPITGQRVGRVSVREEFVKDPTRPGDGKVWVYVDDGSGDFVATTAEYPYGIVSVAATAADLQITLSVQEGILPNNGFLILDPLNDNSHAEVCEFKAVAYSSATVATVTLTQGLANNHSVDEEFIYVEQVDDSTRVTNKFYDLANIAIIDPSMRLFGLNPDGVTLSLLTKYDSDSGNIDIADYFLAPGVGQIEILDESYIVEGGQLYAWYTSYTGLIKEVQRTLDGDIRNPSFYPGVKSCGVNLIVQPPNYVLFDIVISLLLNEGVDGNSERERADRIIRNYVNGLNVGSSFIITEMIKRIKSQNVYDIEVAEPTSNVVADDNEVLVISSLIIS